jgi:hypothetical protein
MAIFGQGRLIPFEIRHDPNRQNDLRRFTRPEAPFEPRSGSLPFGPPEPTRQDPADSRAFSQWIASLPQARERRRPNGGGGSLGGSSLRFHPPIYREKQTKSD